MSTNKRLRPLMGKGEIFSTPRILLSPAFVISCALIPLIVIEGSLPPGYMAGAATAVFVFGGLTLFTIIIPAFNAYLLNQRGVDGEAMILKREQRSQTLITPDYNTITTSTCVTFEFIPQGASSPLQLEAEAGKFSSQLEEGKTAKIRYAKSNPRIVKFIGE